MGAYFKGMHNITHVEYIPVECPGTDYTGMLNFIKEDIDRSEYY